MSIGGAPTPAGTSVFTKHNWDIGMEYLWLNGWGIYHLMGGAQLPKLGMCKGSTGIVLLG